MDMNPQTFYATQSALTEPGAYIHLFADLPHDIVGLCHVVQGLIIHYRCGDMYHYTIPDQRLPEINTRSVENILARIRELDPRPLTEERPPQKRLVGCCRDFATLFCAMARYQDIPTRVRIGFASYFDPHFHHDHEIAECWDASEKRWKLIDPEQSAKHLADNPLIDFDVHDVPRDRFIVAGKAWQRCRRGKADPNLFGVSPDEDLKGLWFIRQKLVQDLAALNKMELLLWDCWGLMLKDDITDKETALLDKVATLTQAGDETFAQVKTLYEHNVSLQVSSSVMSYSPVTAPQEVALAL